MIWLFSSRRLVSVAGVLLLRTIIPDDGSIYFAHRASEH